MGLNSLHFCIAVSVSDLFVWSDAGEVVSAKESLTDLMQALDVKCDAVDLLHKYDGVPSGQGDMYVYDGGAKDTELAFNLYKEPSDQLDLISVYCRTQTFNSAARAAFRSLFDAAQYQVHYEEANRLDRVVQFLNRSAYPRPIGDAGYMQQLVVMTPP
jgi:hypothetical protein